MKTYCIACEIEQHDLCRFNGCTCPCAGECDESTPVCHNPQHWDEDQFHCGLCELDAEGQDTLNDAACYVESRASMWRVYTRGIEKLRTALKEYAPREKASRR